MAREEDAEDRYEDGKTNVHYPCCGKVQIKVERLATPVERGYANH
jgi:hypothetical protein